MICGHTYHQYCLGSYMTAVGLSLPDLPCPVCKHKACDGAAAQSGEAAAGSGGAAAGSGGAGAGGAGSGYPDDFSLPGSDVEEVSDDDPDDDDDDDDE